MTPLHLHHTVPPEKFEDWLEAIDLRMAFHKSDAGGYEGRARTVSSVALLLAATTQDFEPLVQQLAFVATKSTYSRMRMYAYGLFSAIASTNEQLLLPTLQLWDRHVPPCRNHVSVLPDVVGKIVVRFPLSSATNALVQHKGVMDELLPLAMEERAFDLLNHLVDTGLTQSQALTMLLWDTGRGNKTHPDEFRPLLAKAIATTGLTLDTCLEALSFPLQTSDCGVQVQLEILPLGTLCEKIAQSGGAVRHSMEWNFAPMQMERLCTYFDGTYAPTHHLLVSTLAKMMEDNAPTVQKWANRHVLQQATEQAQTSSPCAKRKVL